jgi:hypothetical protein
MSFLKKIKAAFRTAAASARALPGWERDLAVFKDAQAMVRMERF